MLIISSTGRDVNRFTLIQESHFRNSQGISMPVNCIPDKAEVKPVSRKLKAHRQLFAVLTDYMEWYNHKFGAHEPEWHVFPFGSPQPTDPTRHVTTLKTVWNNIRANAGVKERWHDNRHTLITELAESGAGDQTIMDIAGHVSKQMLEHYSHIRMEAKRNTLETVV
jgi:integrase